MADTKLDTGTGGIDIDGKVYTYDVGVESVTPDDVNYSSGQINVDKAKRDLSRGTRVTLGQYLSRTTLGDTPSVPEQAAGGGNRYAVRGVGGNEFVTTGKDGYPVGPQLGQLESFDPGYLNKDDSRPASTLPMPEWRSKPNVSRGMLRNSEKEKFDGNDLLKVPLKPEVRIPAPTAVDAVAEVFNTISGDKNPVKAYSAALIRNRWTSDSRFGEVSNTSTPIAALDYKPGMSYTPAEYSSPKHIFVSQRQLAAVGSVLMARASGEFKSENQNFDPTTDSFQSLAALVPGTAQILIQRPRERSLTAEEVLRDLDLDKTDGKITEGIEDSNFFNITGPNADTSTDGSFLSWGALNNPYDQFTGFSALGMQILAIAFVVAITLIPTLISFAFNTSDDPASNRGASDTDARGRLPLGRYRASDGGSIVADLLNPLSMDWAGLIGFSPTIFPRFKAINVGLLTFFGLDAFAQSSFFKALSPSGPEAYVVFSRAIFRSFLGIADQIKDMSSGVSVTGGALGFFQKILAFIEYLSGSRIIQVLNIFGQLGDQVLNEGGGLEEGDKRQNTVDEFSLGFGGGIRKSRMDSTPIDSNSKSTHTKSRLINGVDSPGELGRNKRLAWSSFRAPDLLIMPSGMRAASFLGSNLGAPSLLPSIEINETYGIKNGGAYRINDEGRLSTPERKNMERILDGEFMPFYFHDIRTNEIISFHAFLTSLGDSYSAAYDSTDAIGRVEAIKTYKNTTRKIDVSFIAAALSEEDFSYMWLKINKLTTMVYPQFSAGKLSSIDARDITIPFSQQIIASPMIRLRIGDLIQSNYSRFNLARLFGYTTESLRFKPVAADYTNFKDLVNNADFMDDYNDELEAAKVQGGNTFYYTGVVSFPSNAINYGKLKTGYLIEIVATPDDAKDKGKIIIDPTYKGIPVPDFTDAFVIDSTSLIPTKETERAVFVEAGGKDAGGAFDYQGAVETFMNDNSVVRSFETSGGRGIAGFIESLSFDWYSGTTWEIEQGKRTPKMCKITLSFSPTHDITPGIDHMGANRAAIYPIGPHAPRR